MFSSNLSTAGGFETRVSHRCKPRRTSDPTFNLPPLLTQAKTPSTDFGWSSGSIMMARPKRSLYSENGVTARSNGNTSDAISLALLMSRGSSPYSFAIRRSDPSVPPAQSESQGVIWEVRESKRDNTPSMVCCKWLYSSRASCCSGFRSRADSMTVLSLWVPFLRYAPSITRYRYPSLWLCPYNPIATCAPRPLKSWLWM
mmetsp:Transcript_147395/g.257641  ORF Transcript_147395/g.257641 Transcript_147395/m.257641 type:complete len:200 (+) Transcript_147395:1627-2226(+)